MSQSDARRARRHAKPQSPVEEMVADALDESRRNAKGWRGTEPAKILNIEQVQVVGAGHQVLLTIETPDGPRAFVIDPDDAAIAGRRLCDIADAADRKLFLPGAV